MKEKTSARFENNDYTFVGTINDLKNNAFINDLMFAKPKCDFVYRCITEVKHKKLYFDKIRAASMVPAIPLALSFAPGESSV